MLFSKKKILIWWIAKIEKFVEPLFFLDRLQNQGRQCNTNHGNPHLERLHDTDIDIDINFHLCCYSLIGECVSMCINQYTPRAQLHLIRISEYLVKYPNNTNQYGKFMTKDPGPLINLLIRRSQVNLMSGDI